MGLFQSEAERIYKAWNTTANSNALAGFDTKKSRATGAFDTVLQG